MKVLKNIVLITLVFSLKFELPAFSFIPLTNNNLTSLNTDIPVDTAQGIVLRGLILNIFNEPVDSVKIDGEINQKELSVFSNYDGYFDLGTFSEKEIIGQSLTLSFFREDYKLLDTVIVFNNKSSFNDLVFSLSPKYKIFLRGRIFVTNSPIENVDVSITHLNKTEHRKTLGCYFDDENYWNCLYLGMFRTEVIADNPDDSVYLSFSKFGLKPMSSQFKFSEYSGEILKFKMKYADSIPDLPKNNLNLKIAYPIGKNKGWFFGFSYYRQLSLGKFDRLMTGLEFSTITLNKSYSYPTLPNTEKSIFDTTYVSLFAGPSIMFFLTKPNIKRFSTYIGSTFSFSFEDFETVIQPLAGTRFFLDMRKSISLEVRYIEYNLIIREYNFNYLGDGIPVDKKFKNQKLLINVGIQINF